MQRASFAWVSLLFLFSQFCFGQQPAPASTAAMRGLRGAVQSVSTGGFKYRDDGEEIPTTSERSVYDRTGFETDFYLYDPLGRLRFHTVYTRNGSHRVKAEINYPSSQKSVQLYNSEGFVTETDTYNGNGALITKTISDYVQNEKPTISTKKAMDGSSSTIERFADDSFKETTVKPDGTTIIHAHYRASPPPLFWLPAGDIYGDWYQTSDANNRPLEFIEDATGNNYRRYSTRYDKDGREVETATYDRFGKLLDETTFRYLQEDENGNWTEQQIWSNAAKLDQVTHRTITYYGNPLDRER
jgi:hypothetical protein